jgi:hypothetical protein
VTNLMRIHADLDPDQFNPCIAVFTLNPLETVSRGAGAATQGPVPEDCGQGAAGHHQGPLQSVLSMAKFGTRYNNSNEEISILFGIHLLSATILSPITHFALPKSDG